jgi:hypothetical protein
MDQPDVNRVGEYSPLPFQRRVNDGDDGAIVAKSVKKRGRLPTDGLL